MRAAVWYGPHDVRVEERSVKPLDPHSVSVRVAWAGICGTDLHEYLVGPIFLPGETPNPITGESGAITLGHEFSGVIEAVGSDVTEWQPGDKVVVNPLLTSSPLQPPFAMYAGCTFIGLGTDGGFADYAVVPEENLYRVPDTLDLELAALVEPTAVCVQALREVGFQCGQSVVVFGAGPIGLLQIQAARAAGATEIFAFDLSDERLEKAKEFGATHAVNSGKEDAVAYVRRLYPNGVDVAFEVAGVQATFDMCVRMTRARGKVCVVSIFEGAFPFNPMSLTLSGVQVVTSLAYEPDVFEHTLKLIENGQLQVRGVITKKIELEDIVSEGFDVLTTDKAQAKILVQLSGER